jgi:Flp pilus assembly protein TadD
VAERYLYLPTVFLCLAFARAISALPRVPALAAACALVAAGTVGTLARQPVWHDDLAFWGDAAAKSPGEGLPHLHLGVVYQDMGRTADAEAEYRTALSVHYHDEGRATAFNNLGMLNLDRDPDAADRLFRQAIEIRPGYATPYYGLGATAFARAKVEKIAARWDSAHARADEAERHFLRAIELDPQYVKAMNQLAALYVWTLRNAEARPLLDTVLQLVSDGPEFDRAMKLRTRIEK